MFVLPHFSTHALSTVSKTVGRGTNRYILKDKTIDQMQFFFVFQFLKFFWFFAFISSVFSSYKLL